MHLAGDIGGTKTALALFDEAQGPHRPIAQRTLASRDFPSFADLARAYLSDVDQRPSCATLGVPGPVTEGHVTGTNLPWDMSEADLERDLGLDQVRLVNDLYALAQAVPALEPDDIVTLNQGNLRPGEAMAVVAPGTGLGAAYLVWNGSRYEPQPSEAGHSDWAPNSPLQGRLLNHLMDRFGHVSNERVCSGTGLPAIYAFLRDVEGYREPAELRARLDAAEDPVPIIVTEALSGERAIPICKATLDLFAEILAAVAGNMALAFLSRGGVYLGGGIPPKILPALRQPAFFEAFCRKGRLDYVMRDIPLHIIVHPAAGLLGAAVVSLGAS
ncbi:MAG: glucokinase [Anaerolineae bacterium]